MLSPSSASSNHDFSSAAVTKSVGTESLLMSLPLMVLIVLFWRTKFIESPDLNAYVSAFL